MGSGILRYMPGRMKVLLDFDKGILDSLKPNCYVHESVRFNTGRSGRKLPPVKSHKQH